MGVRGGAASPLAIGRALLRDVPWLLGGALLALPLLYYLHESWMPWRALFAGLLGAVLLRRITGALLARFPGFLRLNFELGIALVGVLLTSWATLALYPTAYWVFRWRQALALPVAAALLGLGLAALFVQSRRHERVLVEIRDREAALREETLRAELRALQAQINPHFLFNALNALAELTHADAAAAETLVQDLSHLLRYSLRSSSSAQVSLGQELEAVDRYLRVESARLGERLRVERRVEPGLEDLPLPGLVFQPLVENAVRHAVASRPEGGSISIEARASQGTLSLIVEDDGPGLGPAERALFEGQTPPADERGSGGAGGGLANALRRLQLATRGAGRASYATGERGGARIELRLPLGGES